LDFDQKKVASFKLFAVLDSSKLVSLSLRYKKTNDSFMPDQYTLFFKSSSDLPDEVKSLHLAGNNLVLTYADKFKISAID
jgi:hypothetical protein